MSDFYKRLSYSIGNEDWRTEQEALRLQPSSRVLCITGSGDRPLNLLTTGCQEVVAIDLNAVQNHLLALKMGALEQLSFADYMGFLGAMPCQNRMAFLNDLPLNERARTFWLQNKKMVNKGVLYQGVLERVLQKSASLIALIRNDKVKTLFSFDDIDEQRAFVKRYWDKPFFRKILEVFLQPAITKRIFNDPGLSANLMPSLNIGTYLYDRIQSYLNNFLAKESLLLSLILRKRVEPAAYPPYLLEKEAGFIRNRLPSLSFVTDNLITYLENAAPASFDGFSIADVASYLNTADYQRLLRAMVRAARPGARFCMRQFLSAHHIPEDLSAHFIREPVLEERLGREDRCMVYRFMVGTVHALA